VLDDPPLGSHGGEGPAAGSSQEAEDSGKHGSVTPCRMPLTFLSIWAMQESGLPIDLSPDLRRVCLPLLERVLGLEQYKQYR